jgi:enoyl-CoA hydratase
VTVAYQRRGHVAHITMERRESLNALTYDDILELIQCWRRLEQDDAAYVGILSGTPEAFCSGADLKTLLPLITSGGLEEEIVGPDGAAFAKFTLSKPVVAAVRGVCVAGGTELVQATDIRIASDDARFGLPEPRWGLFPAGGSTVRLPRQIPYCRAMEILLTGAQLTADEALRIGLVNRVVPSDLVEDEATAMAELICRNGPLAIRAIKRSVLETSGLPLPDAFAVESRLARQVFKTSDAVEGPLAFAEKRSPRFATVGPAREEGHGD